MLHGRGRGEINGPVRGNSSGENEGYVSGGASKP